MKNKEFSKEELLKHVEETKELIVSLKERKETLTKDDKENIGKILEKLETEMVSEIK